MIRRGRKMIESEFVEYIRDYAKAKGIRIPKQIKTVKGIKKYIQAQKSVLQIRLQTLKDQIKDTQDKVRAFGELELKIIEWEKEQTGGEE